MAAEETLSSAQIRKLLRGSIVPFFLTADNRIGCSDTKDCFLRSLKGLNWITDDERDDLINLINEAGIDTDTINNYFEQKGINKKFSVKFPSVSINNVVDKLPEETCFILGLKLKPHQNIEIKHSYHAVIVCRKNQKLVLYDTQRLLDTNQTVPVENNEGDPENNIVNYLEKLGLMNTDYFIVQNTTLVEHLAKNEKRKNATNRGSTRRNSQKTKRRQNLRQEKTKSKTKSKSKTKRTTRRNSQKTKRLKFLNTRRKINDGSYGSYGS